MLTSLVVKKTQIRTTVRYYFIPIRMAVIKRQTIITYVGEDVKKLKSLCILVGTENRVVALENSMAVLQKLKHRIIIRSSNSTSRYILQKN